MKKTISYVFFFMAFAGLFSSCDDDDGPKLPEYGEARMTSFGFYAEDNQGTIFNDYVGDEVSGDFIIKLPDYVDRTALVARFEVSVDDTVFVDEVQQESGVSAQDFSAPVDYLVSEGTNNAMYSVTVEDLPAAEWSRLASDMTLTRELVMKVNPINNMPYIAYVLSADDSDDRTASVLKLEDNQLVKVGGVDASEGRAAYIRLTFDSAGNPLVSYSDYTNDVSSSASVRKYDNSAWSYVGATNGKGITDVKITYNDIITMPDDNPMLFVMNNAGGALARRELNLSTFNGSSWETSMAMAGRPSDAYAYYPTVRKVGDVIYLGVLNVNQSTFSIYKYEDQSWTTLAEGYRDENATTINLRDFDMDVDADGNVYVAVGDDVSGDDDYRPKVMRYDANAAVWSNVGSPINVDFSTTREFSLAVAPSGIPYLLYRNNSLYPEMVSLDSETQDWTSPVVVEDVESEDLFMDFTTNGIGYAVFTDSNADQTVLYKYDIPQL